MVLSKVVKKALLRATRMVKLRKSATRLVDCLVETLAEMMVVTMDSLLK